MKVVLDTNALIPGIFFSGLPGKILQAWRCGKIQIAVSIEIPEEYLIVAERLTARHVGVEYQGILGVIVENAELVQASSLKEPLCEDSPDDKFLACALAARARITVRGDKALLEASGYRGVKVVTPKEFVLEYLRLNHTRAIEMMRIKNKA